MPVTACNHGHLKRWGPPVLPVTACTACNCLQLPVTAYNLGHLTGGRSGPLVTASRATVHWWLPSFQLPARRCLRVSTLRHPPRCRHRHCPWHRHRLRQGRCGGNRREGGRCDGGPQAPGPAVACAREWMGAGASPCYFYHVRRSHRHAPFRTVNTVNTVTYRHTPSRTVTHRHAPSHTVTHRHTPSHTVTHRHTPQDVALWSSRAKRRPSVLSASLPEGAIFLDAPSYASSAQPPKTPRTPSRKSRASSVWSVDDRRCAGRS